MTEVTIEITQYCPFNCNYCSSNASETGEPLSIEVIEKFLDEIKDKEIVDIPLNIITRINISGGEPLSHPNFYRILKKCYSITPNVWVYTNALSNIIFNSDILKGINIESNTVIIPGKEHYIPDKVNRVHLLKLIKQGRAKSFDKLPEITVSRNFYDPARCDTCEHILLQADSHIVTAPCKKEYLD